MWQLLKKGHIKMLQAAVKFSYPEPFKYIIALQNLDFCTLLWSCYLVWITLLSEVHMSRKARREHAERGDDHREPWCRERPLQPPPGASRAAPASASPRLCTARTRGCGKKLPGTATGHLLRPSTSTCLRGSDWVLLSWIPPSDPWTLRMRQTLWRLTVEEKEHPRLGNARGRKGHWSPSVRKLPESFVSKLNTCRRDWHIVPWCAI